MKAQLTKDSDGPFSLYIYDKLCNGGPLVVGRPHIFDILSNDLLPVQQKNIKIQNLDKLQNVRRFVQSMK